MSNYVFCGHCPFSLVCESKSHLDDPKRVQEKEDCPVWSLFKRLDEMNQALEGVYFRDTPKSERRM